MKTTNVSTLKIHKLTQAQYDRELANGTIDENAIYLTPDEGNGTEYAPLYTYGTEDLTAGTSELETGKLHFVYE